MKENVGPVAIIIGVVVVIGLIVMVVMMAGKADSVNNSGPIGQRPGYAAGGGAAGAGSAPQGASGGYRPGMAGQGGGR